VSLQVPVDGEEVFVPGGELVFGSRVPNDGEFRMKLRSQDVAEFGVFDRFDDFPIQRRRRDRQPLAQLEDGLVMGAHDRGMITRLESHLPAEFAFFSELDGMNHVGEDGLVVRAELSPGIRMPVVPAERNDVFDKGLSVDFGPDVLDERPARSDVERLTPEADGEHREARPLLEESLDRVVLGPAEEVKDERELEIVAGGMSGPPKKIRPSDFLNISANSLDAAFALKRTSGLRDAETS